MLQSFMISNHLGDCNHLAVGKSLLIHNHLDASAIMQWLVQSSVIFNHLDVPSSTITSYTNRQNHTLRPNSIDRSNLLYLTVVIVGILIPDMHTMLEDYKSHTQSK